MLERGGRRWRGCGGGWSEDEEGGWVVLRRWMAGWWWWWWWLWWHGSDVGERTYRREREGGDGEGGESEVVALWLSED